MSLLIRRDIWVLKPAFEIGQPLAGYGVGVVLRSDNSDVVVGQHLHGRGFIFEQYFVLLSLPLGMYFIDKHGHPGLPLTTYLGALGVPGKTAWAGWKDFASSKKGETVFVSSGASAVGTMVIQLAKLDGLKIIASAGSEEKVEFLRKLGVDVAFNYKTVDTRGVLEREGPIDIYWDSVAGETFNAAIDNAAAGARFLECGQMTTLNSVGSHALTINNPMPIFGKSVSIHFISSFVIIPKHVEEFYRVVPAALSAGTLLRSPEDVRHGLECVGEMIRAVQSGETKGKAMVVVGEEAQD
ncbi:alcohol dehydrogenase [Roridomyces roridus]|uniref:Alcohol dehydrogenase n=1 Tax=Roridomyces roridus TaxID=1738132 RepID=A0AAD7B3U1_9AGAR|nr:alcohol dehydrogenase [Roridomyces roridus]